MARRITLSLGLALLGGALAAVPADACAVSPPRISLSGFSLAVEPRRFYLGLEGENTAVTVVLSGGCGSTMSVTYATSQGTATSGQDYTHTSGTVSEFVAGDESVLTPVPVAISSGGDPEPVVESVTFSLSNPLAPGQGTPALINTPAPILIVDSDGASRVGFEGVPYSQSETFPTARIPVFWAGPGVGSSSVTYSIEPGPSNPATPGADYTGATSGTVNFAGKRWTTIDLGIVNDQLGEGPEDVTVALSGAAVASPSSMTLTILDNEESEPPTSRFHHPRHTWRYKKSDYRIREFHVFASDNPGGAGVVATEIALRRNLKNGKCAWLTPSGWQKKDCGNRTWLPTKYDDVGELFYYRMKQLKSSVRTRIRDYTAFSRAIDGAENVEKDFVKKRNANTFEIKRSRRRR